MGLLLSMPSLTSAQDELASGIPFYKPVVELPLAYRDILRTETEGWTREEFIATQGIWRNVELAVSSRDAFGGFSELSTAYWDTANSFWENNYKAEYSSIYNSESLVEEKELEVNYTGTNFKVKTVYTYYPNKKEKQVDFYYQVGSTYTPESNRFLLYDANNKRRIDSVVYLNPASKIITYYTYDNNGRCTESVERNVPQRFGIDTISQSLYEYYTTGELKRVISLYNFNQGGPLVKIGMKEYTYTQDGKIDKVFDWYRQNSSLELFNIYSHYYTASKLSAITSHYFQVGQENYNDSIVLNYLPNNQYDTAKIYRKGATPMSWATTPMHRMIFVPATTTGINKAKSLVTTLKAYPNPVTNTLFVQLDAATNGTTDLVLTDITGKVLKTQTVQFFAGQTTTTELQIDDLATGIYMLRAGNNTIKVIKQ